MAPVTPGHAGRRRCLCERRRLRTRWSSKTVTPSTDPVSESMSSKIESRRISHSPALCYEEPEAMQYRDEEIRQYHGAGDTKAAWLTLSKKYSPQYSRPHAMTKWCEQATDNCLNNGDAHMTAAGEKGRKGIASALQGSKAHANSTTQQQSVHLRSMRHAPGEKYHRYYLAPLLN